MSVGRRLGHHFAGNHAAAAVFDDNGLAQIIRQQRRQDARRQIAAAAGFGRHQPDDAVGIVLCDGRVERP